MHIMLHSPVASFNGMIGYGFVVSVLRRLPVSYGVSETTRAVLFYYTVNRSGSRGVVCLTTLCIALAYQLLRCLSPAKSLLYYP